MEFLLLFPIVVLGYFLPLMIASLREHDSAVGVGLLNLLLGWTFLGWVAALIWAVSGKHTTEPSPVTVQNQSRNESVADELEKLVGLKDRGVLSELEYDAQKASVLQRSESK